MGSSLSVHNCLCGIDIFAKLVYTLSLADMSLKIYLSHNHGTEVGACDFFSIG